MRSPFGNPGIAIADRLRSMGAFVEDTRNGFITHIIFRNGDLSSRSWAETRRIHLVTPAWVKACADEQVSLITSVHLSTATIMSSQHGYYSRDACLRRAIRCTKRWTSISNAILQTSTVRNRRRRRFPWKSRDRNERFRRVLLPHRSSDDRRPRPVCGCFEVGWKTKRP